MSRFFRLYRLKCLDLLNQPVMLSLLVLLPILFGLIAGTANTANDRPDIVLAVIDRDQSGMSRQVIRNLQDSGWKVLEPASANAAREVERLLISQQIDGAITIQKGFDENLTESEEPGIEYTQAEGSLVTTLVREAIIAVILPEYSRRYMLGQLKQLYLEAGQPEPVKLEQQLADDIQTALLQKASLKIRYIGDLNLTPTLTFVVSDYSMEVFFLSIYAVLGSLALAQAALRQRLGSTSQGLALDYVVTLASLQSIGLLQILLYTAAMHLFMPRQTIRPTDLAWLGLFLFLMLGIGQVLSAIAESLRLYLSLMLLLVSAIAGGCFFQLSSDLLDRIGQYSPHGWVLSAIKGYPVLPVPFIGLFTGVLLILGYVLQRRRMLKQA